METLEEVKAKAILSYPKLDKKGKSELEAIFGKETFEPKYAIDSVEAAYKYHNVDASCIPDFSKLPERFRAGFIADVNLTLVIAAINKNRIADYTEDTLYVPYFRVRKDSSKLSGFAFSYYGWTYANSHSAASVGSRFGLFTTEDAVYVGEKFTELYEQSYLINKSHRVIK